MSNPGSAAPSGSRKPAWNWLTPRQRETAAGAWDGVRRGWKLTAARVVGCASTFGCPGGSSDPASGVERPAGDRGTNSDAISEPSLEGPATIVPSTYGIGRAKAEVHSSVAAWAAGPGSRDRVSAAIRAHDERRNMTLLLRPLGTSRGPRSPTGAVDPGPDVGAILHAACRIDSCTPAGRKRVNNMFAGRHVAVPRR